MRVYKFRGKRKDNGEWVYGDLLHNIDCVKIREWEVDVNQIPKSYVVDEKTVEQFTELYDKNGREIYQVILNINKGEMSSMTNTEIKEVIGILKKEGCNSKKQAIEYLEEKLKIFKIGDRVKIINPRYSYYKKIVTIVEIINDRYIVVESDDKKFYGGLLEHDLMKVNERS